MELIEGWEKSFNAHKKTSVIKELVEQLKTQEDKFKTASKAQAEKIIDLQEKNANLRSEEDALKSERNIRFGFITARAHTGKHIDRIMQESETMIRLLNAPLDEFYKNNKS